MFSKENIRGDETPGSIGQNDAIIFDSVTSIWQPNGLPFNAQLALKNANQAKIIIKIIEHLQDPIKKSIGYKGNPIQLSLFKDMLIDENFIQLDFNLSEFGIQKSNYSRLKRDFIVLHRNYSVIRDTVYYNTKIKEEIKGSEIKSLIASVILPDSYERYISIKIDKDVADLLVKIGSAGYTRYLLEIAMSSKSRYTLLIYQLISTWKTKGVISWTIPHLKQQLGITGKYTNWKDLNSRILKPAYRELFEQADCWFQYSMEKKNNQPYKIHFKIIDGDWQVKHNTSFYSDTDILYTVDYQTLSAKAKAYYNFCIKTLLINDINIVCEIVSEKLTEFEQWYLLNRGKLDTIKNPSGLLLHYLGMTKKQGWNARKWEFINMPSNGNDKVNDTANENGYAKIWDNICRELCLLLDNETVERWFRPLRIGELIKEDKITKIVICVPFESFFQKIEADYIRYFYDAIVKVTGGQLNLSYRITSPE